MGKETLHFMGEAASTSFARSAMRNDITIFPCTRFRLVDAPILKKHRLQRVLPLGARS
ncbi:MAG: hypothetical protein WBP72_18095 [Rhodocyclaceae bacterium]